MEILRDFDALVNMHRNTPPEKFNDDDLEYKRIITEAIDCKAFACLKMNLWLQAVRTECSKEHCERIFEAPLLDFASAGKKLRLQTGILEFPWTAVVDDKSPEVDLSTWSTVTADENKIALVSRALAGNMNLRTFEVSGGQLRLDKGWETTEIDWSSKDNLPAEATTMVLQCCTRLTKLNLRYFGWIFSH